MRFARLNGLRVEANPKLRAMCPGCDGEVVAKCGRYKVWHWSHLSRAHCDPWWETESEWHRAWKNRFPEGWQEVPIFGPPGELHIADVMTPSKLVIEFQRSSIHPDEVRAREDFYQSMIWVVDGCKNDSDRFYFYRSEVNEFGRARFDWVGRGKLFQRWQTDKPVFIDFGPEHGFWKVLMFDPSTKKGLVEWFAIDNFVELVCSGTTDFSGMGGPASE
jgi:competence protein CoiA